MENKNTLSVIKIGGNIIDDDRQLTVFLEQFRLLPGYRILVHGGGKIATDIGAKLGIEPNYVAGRRITDEQTLRLVTMVYGGLINKNIVARLQALGCNAIGLTGADAGLLPATRRPVKDIDYGYVGDVNSAAIDSVLLSQFLGMSLVPVFAPLTHDRNGSILNTNADTIAQELAKAMAEVMKTELIYCFEKKGVLANEHDDATVVKEITESDFKSMKENGVVTGGMIPKLENALAAVAHGVSRVVIGHAGDIVDIIKGNAGTCIR